MRCRLIMDDNQRILLKRCLNKDGKAQTQLTKLCDKYMDSYVPFDTGNLKDIQKTVKKKEIIYAAPYARRQYFENRGTGPKSNGRRGRLWDIRMWTVHGNTIVQAIANMCGGRVG